MNKPRGFSRKSSVCHIYFGIRLPMRWLSLAFTEPQQLGKGENVAIWCILGGCNIISCKESWWGHWGLIVSIGIDKKEGKLGWKIPEQRMENRIRAIRKKREWESVREWGTFSWKTPNSPKERPFGTNLLHSLGLDIQIHPLYGRRHRASWSRSTMTNDRPQHTSFRSFRINNCLAPGSGQLWL